jgi:putative FmdB family regulatory protein
VPTYDYVCGRCGHRIEVVHGIHGHGPKACPSCGAEGTMTKGFVTPAIHYKGSGWAKKDRSATSVPGKAGAGSAATPTSAGSEPTTSAPTTGDGGAGSTSSGAGSASSGTADGAADGASD